jgi:hypothetical protein
MRSRRQSLLAPAFLWMLALCLAGVARADGLSAQAARLDAAAARVGGENAARDVAREFSQLAGSGENAVRLVQALTRAERVSLSAANGKSVAFRGPQRALTPAECFLALAIAREKLPASGKPANLATLGRSLSGPGGVLRLRDDGMSWENIAAAAKASSPRLSEAMARQARAWEARAPAVAASPAGAKPEPASTPAEVRLERPERPERYERPERPERPAGGAAGCC